MLSACPLSAAWSLVGGRRELELPIRLLLVLLKSRWWVWYVSGSGYDEVSCGAAGLSRELGGAAPFVFF